MQIRIPRVVARFNRFVTNPIQSHWAGRVPPWTIVIHTGRRSGREYRTPVIAGRRGDRIAIPVLYGEESDWVRNVLAADGGDVLRAGRRYRLIDPHIARWVGGTAIVARLAPR